MISPALPWLNELTEKSLVVVDPFFTPEEWALLQTAYRRRFDLNRFAKAGVGLADPHTEIAALDRSIRRDSTCWIDEGDEDLQFLQNKFASVRQQMNEALYLNLASQEFHFSHYAEGAFYRRHLDRFQNGGRRVVSLVVYLNETWQPEWGGALRAHLEPVRDIEPAPNHAVFFLSADVTHEVLPTLKPRKSLTGWVLSR